MYRKGKTALLPYENKFSVLLFKEFSREMWHGMSLEKFLSLQSFPQEFSKCRYKKKRRVKTDLFFIKKLKFSHKLIRIKPSTKKKRFSEFSKIPSN